MLRIDLRLAMAAGLLALGAGWFAGGRAAEGTATAVQGLESASDLDLTVDAQAVGRTGFWMYPGVRNLQPRAFGSVNEPWGSEFFIGVPLYDRIDDGQGNWTTTALPTMASNVTTPLNDTSECRLVVRDRTPLDLNTFTSATQDEVSVSLKFIDPFGRKIAIRSTQPLPKGPFHEFFGGVVTNHILHGRTGLGGKLPPQVFCYIATWSLAEVTIDGQLLPNNDKRLLHTMVTQGIRDPGNDPGPAGGNGPFMGRDDEVDKEDLELHVVLPPVRFVPTPQPNTPVVGFPQEFVHLVFENVELSGTSLNGTIRR